MSDQGGDSRLELELRLAQFEHWAKVWHETCETMTTLLGLPGGGSPQEMLAQVQAYITNAAARIEALEAALREIKDQYLTPDQSSAIARAALEQDKP